MSEDIEEYFIVVRSVFARSRWERFCRRLVGDPVHMDTLLLGTKSPRAAICYSSYVNQKFEAVPISQVLVQDDSMKNHCLRVSQGEFQKCVSFMQALVDAETSYDYLDAMLLMPARIPSLLRSDVQPQQVPSSVFCSQSVVLMLRDCLDPDSRHGVCTLPLCLQCTIKTSTLMVDCFFLQDLVTRLAGMNSRLSSPRDVYDAIVQHRETFSVGNDVLLGMCNEQEGA
jgi:hypothetical protein